MAEQKQIRKPGKFYYACQTPKEHCLGSAKPECGQKIHPDQGSAYRCTCKYLIKMGFERISAREWRMPQGGILVLDKKCLRGNPGKYDGLIKGVVPRLPSPQVVV